MNQRSNQILENANKLRQIEYWVDSAVHDLDVAVLTASAPCPGAPRLNRVLGWAVHADQHRNYTIGL